MANIYDNDDVENQVYELFMQGNEEELQSLKSHAEYERQYDLFGEWLKTVNKSITTVNAVDLTVYLRLLSKAIRPDGTTIAPNSLFGIYSKIKKVVYVCILMF